MVFSNFLQIFVLFRSITITVEITIIMLLAIAIKSSSTVFIKHLNSIEIIVRTVHFFAKLSSDSNRFIIYDITFTFQLDLQAFTIYDDNAFIVIYFLNNLRVHISNCLISFIPLSSLIVIFL